MENLSEIEAQVITRIAEGDQRAFRELVNKYNSTVYAFVATNIRSAELIEETVSDVFMQIWLTRETLPELKNLGTYLFVIARNKAVNALKSELREISRRIKWDNGDVSQTEKEHLAMEEKALGLIDQAIENLPAQQKKVWKMSRKQSLTYIQIAQELGLSRETVKSYLQIANESIKSFVTERLDDFAPLVLFLILLEMDYPLN